MLTGPASAPGGLDSVTAKASSLPSASPLLSSPLLLESASLLDGAKPGTEFVGGDRTSHLSCQQKPEEWPGDARRFQAGHRRQHRAETASDSDIQ